MRNGGATPKMRELVFKKFGERCFYCGTIDGDPDFTIDHVVPICIGGLNVHTNMVPSCNYCNTKKRDNPPTVAQLHCLEALWGVNHIPRERWEELSKGVWFPVHDILIGERRPITQRQKMWMKQPNCWQCSQPTYFHIGNKFDMQPNAACLTNYKKGELKRIYCRACIERRDQDMEYKLSRNGGVFA